MTWSPKTNRLSLSVPDSQTNENYFYPLWNNILSECFPEYEFAVCPQYPVRPSAAGREGAIDYAVTYLVTDIIHEETPVFFVEVKPPTDLRYRSARANAAVQMKGRFTDLVDILRIPKLYGVSAFGRNVAYFSYNSATEEVDPPIDSNDTHFIRDVAPITWWDTNIMEDAGREKFRRIVNDVKEMALSLGS